MNDLTNIFNHSHCLSKEQLMGYLSQSLDKEEVYLVETHLNDCQFCSDAIDGLMEAELTEFEEHHKQLKTELKQKLTLIDESKIPKVEPVIKQLSINKSNTKKWMAAASILLVVGLGGYSVFSYIKSQKHELALKEDSKYGKDVPVEYNEPKNPESGEIIHLEVKPEDLARSETKTIPEDKKAEIDEKLEKSISTKEVDIAKKPQIPALAKQEPKKDVVTQSASQAREAIAVSPTEPAKSELDNVRDIGNANNYAEEKEAVLKQEEVIAKASTGKMNRKYSNQSPVPSPSNQLNYPPQNRNESANNNDMMVQSTTQTSKETYSNKKKISMDDYAEGMQSYNEGNYKRSVKLLEKALRKANETNREDIQFHLAQAYLKQGDQQKAISLFEQLANGKKYKTMAVDQLQKLKPVAK